MKKLFTRQQESRSWTLIGISLYPCMRHSLHLLVRSQNALFAIEPVTYTNSRNFCKDIRNKLSKTSFLTHQRFCCGSSVKSVVEPVKNMTSDNESALVKSFVGVHQNCRNVAYPRSAPPVQRFPVPDENISWDIPWSEYSPIQYTDPKTIGAVWADPPIGSANFTPQFNTLDGKTDRTSHMGAYGLTADGHPRNPMGRTGLCGRGQLGKWGPNHAADPIVTRWKRDSSGAVMKNESTGKPILQAVCILRGDCGEWAIPGGMVDAGEVVSTTLKREFGEEALNSFQMSDTERHEYELRIEQLFADGILVYKGYVDDRRNTDNSWIETVAMNFHDESGDTVGSLNFHAGDDAVGVQWADLAATIRLYASHNQFIEAVVRHRAAHW